MADRREWVDAEGWEAIRSRIRGTGGRLIVDVLPAGWRRFERPPRDPAMAFYSAPWYPRYIDGPAAVDAILRNARIWPIDDRGAHPSPGGGESDADAATGPHDAKNAL